MEGLTKNRTIMSKVYLFLADGFETVEALAPVDVMRRAGIEVVTVSIMQGGCFGTGCDSYSRRSVQRSLP